MPHGYIYHPAKNHPNRLRIEVEEAIFVKYAKWPIVPQLIAIKANDVEIVWLVPRPSKINEQSWNPPRTGG